VTSNCRDRPSTDRQSEFKEEFRDMHTRHLITWAAAFLLYAATASAQAPAPQGAGGTGTGSEPTFELTGGYQFLHAGEDLNFPFGLNVDAAWSYRPNLSLVGEIGWSFKSEDFGIPDADLNLHEWTFAAGPRWNGRGERRVWPFAQVLAGAAVTRTSGEVGGIEDSQSSTHFMLQPGVGVNIVAGDGWGFVGQVDYRRLFVGDDDEDGEDDDSDGDNQFRVFFGVRMILD
jgi:hypothetical protein